MTDKQIDKPIEKEDVRGKIGKVLFFHSAHEHTSRQQVKYTEEITIPKILSILDAEKRRYALEVVERIVGNSYHGLYSNPEQAIRRDARNELKQEIIKKAKSELSDTGDK